MFIYCVFFIHSSIDEYLGYSVLAILNSAAMNIEVARVFLNYVSLRYMLSNGIAGIIQGAHLGVLCDLDGWDMVVGERAMREEIYVYIYLIHFVLLALTKQLHSIKKKIDGRKAPGKNIFSLYFYFLFWFILTFQKTKLPFS